MHDGHRGYFARCRAGKEKGFRCRALYPAGKSRAAAFTSGDLPAAPGGGWSFRSMQGAAALSRFAMARGQLFSAAAPSFFAHRALRDATLRRGGFASRSKIAAPRHPPLCSSPCGCKPSPPPAGDRREGRDGRG